MSVGSFVIPNSNCSLHCKSPWKFSGWASHLLVHCGEVGDCGRHSLQMFFWLVAFTNHREGGSLHPIGRLQTRAYTIFDGTIWCTHSQWGSLANPEQWPRPIQSLRGVLTVLKWKKLSLVRSWEEEHCHQVPWFCWAWTKHRLSWRLEYRVRFGPEADGDSGLKQQICVFSRSSCGSGSQQQLSWVVLAPYGFPSGSAGK